MGDTGGKGQENQSGRLQDAYSRGGADYKPGVDPYASPGVNDSDLSQAYVMGWQQTAAQQAAQQQHSFAMPEWADVGFSSEDYLADLEAQRAEQARQAAISQRDSLYSSRLDAASSATDYINSQIAQEQSAASMMGMDYEMTDEIKSQRINNYFATLWGEGDESQLGALIGSYGAPTGHTEFSVVRGDASAFTPKEGSEESKGTSKGVKPKTILTDDEEGLGGNQTILGV
jgi:hypothetical protein